MLIAYAEELKMLCDSIKIDFDELRESVNTKWNTEILEAKSGIGGHCLPKDSQMLLELSQDFGASSMIKTAKKIDANYRLYIATQTREL